MKDTQKEPREYFERVDVVIKRLSNLVEEQNGTNTLCSNQVCLNLRVIFKGTKRIEKFIRR